METIKVIILGESNVGKSSLVSQFTNGWVSNAHDSTVGVEFSSKICEKDGEQVKLQLWDTAGQERFRAMVRMYYKHVSGVVLVYDVTNMVSFEQMNYWISEVQCHCGDIPSSKIYIIGNKTDLESYRTVGISEGEQFAAHHGANYSEISCRDHGMVSAFFERLVSKLEPKLHPNTNIGVDLKEKRKGTCC